MSENFNNVNEPIIVDNLQKFGNEFATKCLTCLVSDRLFLERIFDILDSNYFESAANRWICDNIKSYFIQYKSIPTLLTFKVKIDTLTDEILKKSVIDQLRNVYIKISDTDIDFVKTSFLEFCKNQKLKSAILESVDYLKLGQYDQIKHLVDDAIKAGMERNLGHIYFDDVDKRMSELARDTIKTNWQLIDELMDGGLGKGELGFIVACAGSGKCVSGSTKIEIQYEEIGIPVAGILNKEYIIWLNPFKKYDLGNELGILYGWQIDHIFNLNK